MTDLERANAIVAARDTFVGGENETPRDKIRAAVLEGIMLGRRLERDAIVEELRSTTIKTGAI